jgi:hypothetical protein
MRPKIGGRGDRPSRSSCHRRRRLVHMDTGRLGRVVAVALLALLTPVACAALGVGTPVVSGLPPSPGSASPAVQQGGGAEAPTGSCTETELQPTTRRTGYWAVPASHQPRRHASKARVRVFVPSDHDVVDREVTGPDNR